MQTLRSEFLHRAPSPLLCRIQSKGREGAFPESGPEAWTPDRRCPSADSLTHSCASAQRPQVCGLVAPIQPGEGPGEHPLYLLHKQARSQPVFCNRTQLSQPQDTGLCLWPRPPSSWRHPLQGTAGCSVVSSLRRPPWPRLLVAKASPPMGLISHRRRRRGQRPSIGPEPAGVGGGMVGTWSSFFLQGEASSEISILKAYGALTEQ